MSPDERRSEPVTVRFTRAEYTALEQRAVGQTLSDYLRAAAFGQPVARQTGIDPVLAHDLRQIARRHPEAATAILALLR